MRKSLLPMLAALALSGAAITALVISTAHAQSESRNPAMVSPPAQLVQNGPRSDGPPRRDLRRREPLDLAARMKQMCQDRYARTTGELAYLQTKLALTASQQSAFQRWSQAKLGIAKRQADTCAQRPLPDRSRAQGQMSGPGEIMGREEDRLKQRLSDIQTERPVLEALYNTLSSQQRVALTRAGRQDRMGQHRVAGRRLGRMDGPMGGSISRANGSGPNAPPPAAR